MTKNTESQRKNIVQPADWWVAFEQQAAAEDLTLSQWMGECCRVYLHAGINSTLSERQPAHRPKGRIERFNSGRSKICGHTATSILRWMGKAGWDKDAAMAAFSAMQLTISPRTIDIQLKCGQDGTRGGAPNLEPSDVAYLKSMRHAGRQA